MRTPFIIGEAGSCHEGSFTRAQQLIDVAKAADADAIKFQYWSSPARMRERRAVDDLSAYEKGSVKATWLPLLADVAHAAGLEFMATAYLPEDIEVIAPYVDRFKISSFEGEDAEFVDAHLKYHKEVIVSTGMREYTKEKGMLVGSGPVRGIRTLHCVSAYPTPAGEANLLATGRWTHGYSDHTRCVYTGGFAVSAGADILEVHFRLDDTSPDCPDYPVALSPSELMEYVRLARLAHTMRGDGVKQPQPSEIPNMKHRVQP